MNWDAFLPTVTMPCQLRRQRRPSVRLNLLACVKERKSEREAAEQRAAERKANGVRLTYAEWRAEQQAASDIAHEA